MIPYKTVEEEGNHIGYLTDVKSYMQINQLYTDPEIIRSRQFYLLPNFDRTSLFKHVQTLTKFDIIWAKCEELLYIYIRAKNTQNLLLREHSTHSEKKKQKVEKEITWVNKQFVSITGVTAEHYIAYNTMNAWW